MPAHIALIIKGTRAEAFNSAYAHQVHLFSTHPDRQDSGLTHALCGEEYAMAVVRWFLEPPAIPGAAGTLLEWEGRPTVWRD